MAGAPTAAGFLYFSAVKAAGYTAMAFVLKRGYGLRDSPQPSVFAAGMARTGIGLFAGLAYGGLWLLTLGKALGDASIYLFYAFLLPVRFAEWSLLIWLFFDPGLRDRPRWWKFGALGILCSYALDAIGVAAAFVLPGGFWVC